MAIEKQAIPQPLQPEQEIELEIVQPEIPEDTEVTTILTVVLVLVKSKKQVT